MVHATDSYTLFRQLELIPGLIIRAIKPSKEEYILYAEQISAEFPVITFHDVCKLLSEKYLILGIFTWDLYDECLQQYYKSLITRS
jgi:hypothetical protein